jgi:hypothetical protein
MPGVGFEPTIPVFERAKTVHALDRAATVIGGFLVFCHRNLNLFVIKKQFLQKHKSQRILEHGY